MTGKLTLRDEWEQPQRGARVHWAEEAEWWKRWPQLFANYSSSTQTLKEHSNAKRWENSNSLSYLQWSYVPPYRVKSCTTQTTFHFVYRKNKLIGKHGSKKNGKHAEQRRKMCITDTAITENILQKKKSIPTAELTQSWHCHFWLWPQHGDLTVQPKCPWR